MADSRWWWWVAGVPAVAAVWCCSFLWLALAATSEFGAGGVGGNTVVTAFWLSLAVAGVPLTVVLVMLPVAVYRDARALRAADAAWRPDPRRWAGAAALAAPTAVGGVALAAYYCYRRLAISGRPEGGLRSDDHARP